MDDDELLGWEEDEDEEDKDEEDEDEGEAAGGDGGAGGTAAGTGSTGSLGTPARRAGVSSDDVMLGASAMSEGALVRLSDRGPSLDETADDPLALGALGPAPARGGPAGGAAKPAAAVGHLASLAEFLAPFRDHDFRWAFLSRLSYQQAVYTVQTYLLYYIRDAVELPKGLEPHAALSFVMLPLLCCALLSPLVTGFVSDASGGKKRGLLVGAGVVMIVATTAMALTRSWALLPWLGAAFGAGYGAFNALDFALAMDVLPGGDSSAAKDLGLWNLALAIPMCLAAPVGGILLDRVNRDWGHHAGYSVLFGMAAMYLVMGVAALSRVKRLR